MGRNQIRVILFSSLLLSSCGLVEKFTNVESTVESTENTSTTSVSNDELFNNTSAETAKNETHTDAPSNVKNDPVAEQSVQPKDDFQSLQNEFSNDGPKESQIAEVKAPEEKIKAAPLKIKETAPVIDSSLAEAKVDHTTTGEIKNYKVQKGETLMQIAFKLYGDISRWKDIKKLNGDKLKSNASLKSNLTLKYEEPETPFVWNPEGNPYLIKNGETLGTISNSLYQTPKKWKKLWENNKPLIKNPNIIYAGFTLYYKGGEEMANYVQPKSIAKKVTQQNNHSLDEIEKLDSTVEEVKYIRSSTLREPAQDDEPTTEPTPPTMPTESDDDTDLN